MVLEHFGNIKEIQRQYYENEISLDGNNVKLILDLEEGSPGTKWCNECSSIMQGLEKYERQISKHVRLPKSTKESDFTQKVYYYTKHHAMDLTIEELADLLGEDADDRLPIETQLAGVLYLYSIKFTKDYIFWNYTVGENYSNYLLSIKTNCNLKVLDMKTIGL